MSLRRQLPVYSPLSASALFSGAGALFGGGTSSRRQVLQWLEGEWRTREPLLTGTGTMALTLAMMASPEARRRGIALPAYGCYDLVTAALGAGVPVRWYDLDPATLGPDWSSLEGAVTAGAGAIVIAHYYGVPVDLGPVRELAGRHGSLIIEDAAQGIGGSIGDTPLGGLGDMGILSFGRGKGLTGGGGGALLINTAGGQKAFADLSESLPPAGGGIRALVTTTAQWLLARPAAYALPSALPFLKLGETVFREPEPLRDIDSVALGILAKTRHRVAPEAEARRQNAAWFIDRFESRVRVPGSGVGRPGYLRLPVLMGNRERSPINLDAMAAQGVMPGYPRVLNALPGPTSSGEDFRGASELVEQLVTLPVHSLVSEGDRAKICHWIVGQD